MRRATFVANLATLLAGGTWLSAQQPAQPYQPAPSDPPNILSGPDIGFRVTGSNRGNPVGTLVIRTRSGDWVEVEFEPRPRTLPLETR
jgi:hypothetical protein